MLKYTVFSLYFTCIYNKMSQIAKERCVFAIMAKNILFSELYTCDFKKRLCAFLLFRLIVNITLIVIFN